MSTLDEIQQIERIKEGRAKLRDAVNRHVEKYGSDEDLEQALNALMIAQSIMKRKVAKAASEGR